MKNIRETEGDVRGEEFRGMESMGKRREGGLRERAEDDS